MSLLEIGDGVFEVLATNGNTQPWRRRLRPSASFDYLAAEFKKENNIDLKGRPYGAPALKEAAEKAKIELSGVMSTNINLPFITADATARSIWISP